MIGSLKEIFLQISFFFLVLYFLTCISFDQNSKRFSQDFVSSNFSQKEILEFLKTLIPCMKGKYKGECGKVGIIGGSKEYTGAPYYAGISSLKLGSDLVHIFCSESASLPIKNYDPELIVHSTFQETKTPLKATEETFFKKEDFLSNSEKQQIEDSTNYILNWVPKLHSLVIGPGLGRDLLVFHSIKRLLEKMKSSEDLSQTPLVLDGDALYLLSLSPQILHGLSNVILTPNVNEFHRLCEKFNVSKDSGPSLLSEKMGGLVTIIKKGNIDIISLGSSISLINQEENSPRRCGGQGDILAGSIGTFLAWSSKYSRQIFPIPKTVLSAYGGSLITRRAALQAFQNYKRSTSSPNIIHEIGRIFEEIFPEKEMCNF